MAIETLAELHHTCKLCGGSCQGTLVRLFPGEEERIGHLATLLGVERPVVSGRLRLDRGQCVFLGDDRLCRIHKEYGAAAKPAVCNQYPVVATRVGDDVRVGIDPGCYTSISTWRTGPLVPDVELLASPIAVPAGQEAMEERLVDLLSMPDLTVAQAIGALVGEEPPERGLPPRFASRVVTRLRAADLEPLIADPDTARMLRTSLQPLVAARKGWDPDAPPAWPSVSAEAEAYALDAVKRMLWLRLAHNLPSVPGAALLLLTGVVACAWAAPDDTAFGHALAGWCRALRAEVFWRAITPDPATLGWLASGDDA